MFGKWWMKGRKKYPPSQHYWKGLFLLMYLGCWQWVQSLADFGWIPAIFYKLDHYFEMLYKCKSNHSLLKGKDPSLKGKDLSLLQLTTFSNFLEGEQGLAQDITKEIKNEIHLSKKNERIIDKSMSRINERAEELVRRFEEEKEKHEKLTFLVSHIEGEIYNAKLDKSLELKGQAETDQLEQLTTLQRTRERELEKVCEKTNTSSYELSKKLDSIRALRSERTIVSELLDKIERELCNLEHCYKVLVIERTIEDHQCQEKLEEFRKVEQSARREIERVLTLRKDSKEERDEEETKLIVHHVTPAVVKEPTAFLRPSFTQNSIQAGSQASLQPFTQTQSDLSHKEKDRHKEKRAKIESDILKLQREKTVKIVLNDLGISSPKELPESLEDLLRDNDNTLSDLERLELEIEEMEANIWKLAQRKNRRNQKKISEQREGRRDVREQLGEIRDQIRQSKLQSAEFKEIAKILYGSITESLPEPPEPGHFYNEEEEVRYYMGFLQSFFEKSYVEAPSRAGPKDGNASKRLTSLLSSPLLDRNQMSIYEEQDLLQFAKKNLERMEKGYSAKSE